MATVNGTKGGTAGLPAYASNKVVVVENSYDFATNNATAADVIQLINVPANTLVLSVLSECVTAEGGVMTYQVGDGTDPNGWDDAVNGNSAAGVIVGDGAYVAAAGKIYTAADTLDIVPSADSDAAEIRVIAVMVEIG